MRLVSAGLIFLIPVAALAADPPAKHFGLEADLKAFPQTTPKESLASVLKAADGASDYLAAQLADPSFIDDRVKGVCSFDEQVKDVRDARQLIRPVHAAKLLHRFLDDGNGRPATIEAAVRPHPKDGDRVVFFRKIDGRWFMEHRQQAQDAQLISKCVRK